MKRGLYPRSVLLAANFLLANRLVEPHRHLRAETIGGEKFLVGCNVGLRLRICTNDQALTQAMPTNTLINIILCPQSPVSLSVRMLRVQPFASAVTALSAAALPSCPAGHRSILEP